MGGTGEARRGASAPSFLDARVFSLSLSFCSFGLGRETAARLPVAHRAGMGCVWVAPCPREARLAGAVAPNPDVALTLGSSLYLISTPAFASSLLPSSPFPLVLLSAFDCPATALLGTHARAYVRTYIRIHVCVSKATMTPPRDVKRSIAALTSSKRAYARGCFSGVLHAPTLAGGQTLSCSGRARRDADAPGCNWAWVRGGIRTA